MQRLQRPADDAAARAAGRRRAVRPLSTRLTLAATALLLLALQQLGLWHGITHGTALARAVGESRALSGAPPANAAAGDHTPGGTDCRLLDQLCHADLLGATLLPLVLPGPIGAVPPADDVPCVESRACAPRARGPPALA